MKHRLDLEKVGTHGWWGWCSCGEWAAHQEPTASEVRGLHAAHRNDPDDERTLVDLLWEGDLDEADA